MEYSNPNVSEMFDNFIAVSNITKTQTIQDAFQKAVKECCVTYREKSINLFLNHINQELDAYKR